MTVKIVAPGEGAPSLDEMKALVAESLDDYFTNHYRTDSWWPSALAIVDGTVS